MAADAVDAAVHGLGRGVSPSVTERIAAARRRRLPARWNRRHRLAERSGLHVARIEHLLHRYGSLADELLELIAEDPSLAEPLPGADDYLTVEVVYAATHEGAAHLDDVLDPPDPDLDRDLGPRLSAAEPAARLMAGRWAGTTRRSRARSSTTPRGCRPSASPRSRTTTSARTPRGWARRTSRRCCRWSG